MTSRLTPRSAIAAPHHANFCDPRWSATILTYAQSFVCSQSSRGLGIAMAKNILIFSDGTGQAGGIRFDENRTNIYKLYRATRCGPDSDIHPDDQVTFY